MQPIASQRAQRHYRLGSAHIVSEIVLSGLLESDSAEQVAISIRRGMPPDPVGEWVVDPDGEKDYAPAWAGISHWRSADGGWYRLRYDYRGHFADFSIRRDGREVKFHAGAQEDDAELANLIEGGILGRAMRLAGMPCLHANALACDGKAIMLMGNSGVGKSSLGWALVQQGCRLIADDMVALIARDEEQFVPPGRVRLRMWPDVAERLAVHPALTGALFPTAGELEKLGVRDPSVLESLPVRLHAIYRMKCRQPTLDEPLIDDLSASEALVMLAANMHGLIDPGRGARRKELALLARVVDAVPVRSLTIPNDLDALPRVAQWLRSRLFA